MNEMNSSMSGMYIVQLFELLMVQGILKKWKCITLGAYSLSIFFVKKENQMK